MILQLFSMLVERRRGGPLLVRSDAPAWESCMETLARRFKVGGFRFESKGSSRRWGCSGLIIDIFLFNRLSYLKAGLCIVCCRQLLNESTLSDMT